MPKSQWPRGLRRRSAAARPLKFWVRIPPGSRISVCCGCCVLSARDLYDELITRPEESYRLWCVVVWSRNPVSEEALAQGRVLLKRKEKNYRCRSFVKFGCLHFQGSLSWFSEKWLYIQKYNETGLQKSQVNPHFKCNLYKHFNLIEEFQVERRIYWRS